VPFFQDCDDAFIKTVVYRLKSELILAKDVVFHEGDAADEMYFLRRGNVNVLAPRSTRVVATLEEGGYFGEIGILVSNGRRSNTVLAAKKCEYYTLSKADLDWVLDRFPEYRELLRNAALKRLEQMAKVLDASLAGEQGLDLIEGRVLVEVQEMRGVPLTHSGLEKFCRVAVLNHVQNTGHPSQEHVALHDARGHLIHKYDFNAILNFHFEVEQRSFDTVNVSSDKIDKLNVKKNNGLGANFWFFLFHRSCLVSPFLHFSITLPCLYY
jgi:CRP-like cAMP-binding protein